MLLGALSAALLVLAYPPYSAWGLSFFAMVPFFIGVLRAKTWKQAATVGMSTSFFFCFLGFPWVSYVAVAFGGLPWIVGKVVLFLFSLIGELQFLAIALVFWAFLRAPHKLKNKLVSKPAFLVWGTTAAYLCLDWAYPKIFPSTLGHVFFAAQSLAQFAEIGGVYFLTVPVLAANLAIALLIWPETRAKSRRVAIASLGAVAVFLVSSSFWGSSRIQAIRKLEASYAQKLHVNVIQANIGDAEKLASESGIDDAIERVLETYATMSKKAVRENKPDLLIWPETAFPYLYTHGQDLVANKNGSARDEWVGALMKELRTPLFFGSYTSIHGRDFNAAFLLDKDWNMIGRYLKSVLLAFGEYVPLGPFSSYIHQLIPSIADFGRGEGAMAIPLLVKDAILGPQICYEGLVPAHSALAVKKGANILLNITNDSWFGDTAEPWQHLALTAFRAIETRRPILRATNTGISALISATGEPQYRTRVFEPAILDVKIPVPDSSAPRTFYGKFGDWIVGLAAAGLATALVWGRFCRRP